MKKYNFLLIFIFLIISSCTSLSQKMQSILEQKEKPLIAEQKSEPIYCPSDSNTQSLLEDPQFFRSPQFKNAPYTFIEKSVLLALIEMGRRPDITGPYSRLQVRIKINGEFLYYDFRPQRLDDDTKISFLYGLDFLLKKYHSPHSLSNIANYIDRSWPANYFVSRDFEIFLSKSKTDIQKNSELSKLYLKGDEILTKFETFPKPNIQKSIMLFEKKKLFDSSFYHSSKDDLLWTSTDEEKNTTTCNFDIKQDSTIHEDLLFEGDFSSNSFAWTENNNYFVAIASSHIKKPLALADDFYIKARPATSPMPICHLLNPGLKLNLLLTSTSERNPSQHLKHLIDYDIIHANSTESLGNTLNFARHLFLANPDRILYESKRGRREQLNFFLQMNFPIYHVDKIGEVLALANFSQPTFSSIIRDVRSSKQLACTP